jgi:transposase
MERAAFGRAPRPVRCVGEGRHLAHVVRGLWVEGWAFGRYRNMGGADVMDGRCWVGLDVHARQTHAAVLDQGTGELRGVKLVGEPVQVVDFLVGLPGRVSAVYEAGPTGFGLARAATEAGIDMRVAAPGMIPRRPGDRVKTDRRDAERLARLLAAGELTFARVPSLEEEWLRDLVRAREDIRGDLMRARHRLSKFLLRRGLRWTGPAGTWTRAHHSWLAARRFEDPASEAAFGDYLAAERMLEQRRGHLEQRLSELIPLSPVADTVARLRCFRGIDTLSAAGLACEIGDFERFEHPGRVTGFLGLVPGEWTTDSRRRQGSITKAGPAHSRRLLVEAAHHYRATPRIGVTLQRRQEGVDPRVCEIAWRAQRRLHDRWQHLHHRRGKPSGVVAVACARELATFLWEAATLT